MANPQPEELGPAPLRVRRLEKLHLLDAKGKPGHRHLIDAISNQLEIDADLVVQGNAHQGQVARVGEIEVHLPRSVTPQCRLVVGSEDKGEIGGPASEIAPQDSAQRGSGQHPSTRVHL